MAGIELVHVPYKGGGQSIADLISGHIPMIFISVTGQVIELHQTGKIRMLAVTSPVRVTAAPDIPTVDEAGLPGLYVAFWHGLWAPKDTPKEIVATLNVAVVATLADPAVQRRLADLGQEIPPREQQTPQGLGAYQKAEIEKWWPIVKAAGIKVD